MSRIIWCYCIVLLSLEKALVVKNKLEELSQRTVAELHRDLEAYLNADVFTYYGSIVNGVERQVKDIIEALANDS